MQSGNLTDFSDAEKLKEIAREIALRRSLYRIKIGRREMKVEDAARRIHAGNRQGLRGPR